MATKKTPTKKPAAPAKAAKAVPAKVAPAPVKPAEAAVADCSKRDFLMMSANGVAAAGACVACIPLVKSMSSAADVLALSTVEQDISNVEPGEIIKVMWQGKPVFIRRRTPEEIEAARKDDAASMPDPQTDAERVKPGKDEWLVVVGVCTHLGCIPLGDEGSRGEYNGWFCPCHGSVYDTSGRIRKGPAPQNLAVPQYEFITDTVVKIG